MRVCFVIADMTLCGGGERVTSVVANWFTRRFEYAVDIYSIQRVDDNIPFELDTRIGVFSSGLDLPNSNKLLSRIGSLFRLRRFFADNTYDVVIGVGTYAAVLLGLLKPRETLTFTYEQVAFDVCPRMWKVLRWLAYRRLGCLVALTESDRAKLAKLNSVTAVIPNCTDIVCTAAPKLNSKRLLAVGRLSPQKGFDLLLEVFAHLKKAHPDWQLRIVGEGDEENGLKGMTNDLGLTEHVQFAPNTQDIVSEYLAASIYVMTSRWEGFPLVLIEAQSCGLPIVAYDCPTGPREVINDGTNGYLVAAFDEASLYARLSELMTDHNKRLTFSGAAKHHAQRFHAQAVCAQWQNLIGDLVGAVNRH